MGSGASLLAAMVLSAEGSSDVRQTSNSAVAGLPMCTASSLCSALQRSR
jgi:hypothetical protein